jgi:hypothetical protein
MCGGEEKYGKGDTQITFKKLDGDWICKGAHLIRGRYKEDDDKEI